MRSGPRRPGFYLGVLVAGFIAGGFLNAFLTRWMPESATAPAWMCGASTTKLCGPAPWCASRIASATRVSASSHGIRCQRPSPRAPTRRNGCSTRSGLTSA